MRLRRLIILHGLALAALLWCRTAAQADSNITISPAGSGGFAVSGSLADKVTTVELTVEYDTGTLGNPAASCGSLADGAKCEINTGNAGIVLITITAAAPFSGSGVLAGLNFTLLGDDPGTINSLDARLCDSDGNLLTAHVKVINPTPGQTGRPLPKLAMWKGPDSSPPAASTASTASTSSAASTPSTSSTSSTSGGEVQPEASASMVEERPGRVKALLAATALPYQRLESVLERFRGRPGEAPLDSLVPLFEGVPGGGIRQVPPIVLSDGRSTVRLVVESAESGAAAMKFLLRGAHFIALRSEAASTWSMEILPDKGVYEASLIIMTETSLTEYPLTVSPLLDPAEGELGPDDFVRRRKLRAGPGTTAGKDADRPAYVEDYIYVANYLVSRAVSRGK
jgi:hypothetical protein